MKAQASSTLYEKHQIAKSFSQAASTYESAAQLQKHTGQQLFKQFIPLMGQPNFILDIGAGTGYFTQQMAAYFPKTYVIGVDIAMGMMHFAAQQPMNERLLYLCADADHLPFSTASIEGLYSNLMLQWSPNLLCTLKSLKRILHPNGYLCFSTLVAGSLFELKAAWETVDQHAHVHLFPATENVTQAILQSGYEILHIQEETLQFGYQKVQDVLLSLKALGAHNLQNTRLKGLSGKQSFKQLIQAYEKFRNHQQQIPVTYKVLYGIVR